MFLFPILSGFCTLVSILDAWNLIGLRREEKLL
jgi:hypothetical protein